MASVQACSVHGRLHLDHGRRERNNKHRLEGKCGPRRERVTVAQQQTDRAVSEGAQVQPSKVVGRKGGGGSKNMYLHHTLDKAKEKGSVSKWTVAGPIAASLQVLYSRKLYFDLLWRFPLNAPSCSQRWILKVNINLAVCIRRSMLEIGLVSNCGPVIRLCSMHQSNRKKHPSASSLISDRNAYSPRTFSTYSQHRSLMAGCLEEG